MPDDSTALLTRQEVGAYLKLHPRTVMRLVASGKLPVIRVGRSVRFRQSDIDAFIEAA